MAAPAEIPHADEALKTLVQRFKTAPGSSAFTELAAALLARGHAAEALRITEHGLQLVPGSVEGRVQRAAALLAQGRPRMAYVELLRALAIEPQHRRSLRLLGKAFVDAGAPERAAALLAQRSGASRPARTESEPSSNLAAALISDLTDETASTTETTWHPKEKSASALPDLFSSLTKDLGLGAAVPEHGPQRPVEVTQIIRRKARPRPPRSASELAEIDGPIVDTTQPTPAITDDEPAPIVTTRDRVPLYASNPDLTSLSLDDEPLFQEHLPFAVRPVRSGDDSAPMEPSRSDPIANDAGGPDRRAAEARARSSRSDPIANDAGGRSRRAVGGVAAWGGPVPHRTGSITDPEIELDPTDDGPMGFTEPSRSGVAAEAVDRRSGPPPSGSVSAATKDAHRRRPAQTTSAAETAVTARPSIDAFRPDRAAAVVERNRPLDAMRLAIRAPAANRGRWILAIVVSLVMTVYFFGWWIAFHEQLSVWWPS